MSYFPSETNVRLADVVIINKVVEAEFENIETVRDNIREINPDAIDHRRRQPADRSRAIVDLMGKKVLVVEDGPTLTHGDMTYGAGVVAALRMGAEELVDPRPWATGKLAETFEIYPEIGTLLPAMGYGDEQVADLEKTINAVECDAVVIGTPIDLNRIVKIDKPTVRVEVRTPGDRRARPRRHPRRVCRRARVEEVSQISCNREGRAEWPAFFHFGFWILDFGFPPTREAWGLRLEACTQ